MFERRPRPFGSTGAKIKRDPGTTNAERCIEHARNGMVTVVIDRRLGADR